MLLLLGLFASLASASHFRAGLTTWRINENDKLEITLTSSWRDGSGGYAFLGSNCGIAFNQGSSPPVKYTDAAGDPYYTLTTVATYTKPASPCTFEVFDCCRIGNLAFGSGGSFQVQTTYAPGVTMSPTPTNPAIVQIAKAAPGASASVFVPVSQAPGSSISCGLVPGAIGVFGELSVATETGGCRVSWANSGRNAQDKAPVTLRVTSGSTYTDSDFILEISNAAPGSPPTTVVTSNGQAVAQGSTLTFVVGTQYTVTFTSTDPDAGAIIRAQLVGVLPPGATLTGLGPSPTGKSLVSTFTWTPATPNQNGNVQLLVSDETNKQTTASFSFVVPADIVKPVVTVPADITEEAQSPAGRIVTYENYSPAPSASDNIDGTITPTCVPPSGSTFPLGATLVTCNATDAALNTGTASFTVTIVDTTRPVLGVPAPNVLVDATSEFGAPVTYTVTVTDAVTTGIVPMCTPESGSIFGFGSTTVTCNATDAAGNVGYASFMVAVTACAFGGFLPPVENPPQVNLVSTQQNLPLKWGMAGYWGMNILAPGYPRLVAVNCGTFADPDVPTDVPTDATITTSVLKYDTTDGRYMLGYSLKGRTVINTCYQLQLQFTTCPGRTFLALVKAVRNK